MVECPHLQDAVKIGCLKTTYEPPWNCVECGNAKHPWMCLYCGDIRCGRYANAHAIEHFKSCCAHNVLFDCHVYSVYCYACDDYVMNDHTSRTIGLLRAKLQQLNDSTNVCVSQSIPNGPSASGSESSQEDELLIARSSSTSSSTVRTGCELAGLRNLGNTCFMNAVLQALNAVSLLRSYLLTLPVFDEPTRAFAWLCRLPYRPDASQHRTVSPSSPRQPNTASLPDVVADALLASSNLPDCPLTPPRDAICRSLALSATPSVLDAGDGTRLTRNAARRMRAYHMATQRPRTDSTDAHAPQESTDTPEDSPPANAVDNSLLCEELRRLLGALARADGPRRKAAKRQRAGRSTSTSVEPVSPDSLFHLVWQAVPRFRGYQQQDAHEFMRYLLDQLDSELYVALYFHHRTRCCSAVQTSTRDSRDTHVAKELLTAATTPTERGLQKACRRCGWFGAERSSVVTAAFGGVLHSEVGCLQCGAVSVTPESFLDLQLDIPARFSKTTGRSRTRNAPSATETSTKASDDDSNQCGTSSGAPQRDVCTLQDCLESYTAVEQLAETELYRCPACDRRQPSTKRFWIKRLPPVLCLHVKRFSWQHASHDRAKLETFVQFPLRNLDMRPYVLPHCERDTNQSTPPSSFEYDLAAVIVHHGSAAGSGHYTAFAHDGADWFHFNDSHVTPVDEETVRKARAYILLYAQRDGSVLPRTKSPSPVRSARALAPGDAMADDVNRNASTISSLCAADLELMRKKIKLEHSYSKSPLSDCSPPESSSGSGTESEFKLDSTVENCNAKRITQVATAKWSSSAVSNTMSASQTERAVKLRNGAMASACLRKPTLSSSNLYSATRAGSD